MEAATAGRTVAAALRGASTAMSARAADGWRQRVDGIRASGAAAMLVWHIGTTAPWEAYTLAALAAVAGTASTCKAKERKLQAAGVRIAGTAFLAAFLFTTVPGARVLLDRPGAAGGPADGERTLPEATTGAK